MPTSALSKLRSAATAAPPDAANDQDDAQCQEAPLDQRFLLSLVGHSARLAFATIRVYFQRCVSEHGLSPGDFAILSLLHANPDISQRRLADALNVSPPNLAIVLDRLSARELVARERSAADKRSYTLRLTAQGEALHREARKTVAELEDEATAMLAPAEKRELLRLLHKVAGR